MKTKSEHRLRITLAHFKKSKYKSSRTLTFYNTVPFNLKRVEEIILESLEGDKHD